jgi:8-oxo-dGTP diphosphatase
MSNMPRREPPPTSDDEAPYDPRAFPPMAVTVDIVLLTIRSGRLSVLLVERGGPPFEGEWALPGGFVRPDEDLESAAHRELAEEAGIDAPVIHLEQLRTYGAPDRDPRMRVVSVAHLALMPDVPTPVAGTDAAVARFWAVDDLGTTDGPELAFDHEDIVHDAVERARAKLEYSTLATSFVEEPFTITDLRRVYETVWGTELHPANFRRKVLSTTGYLVPTGEERPTGRAWAELFTRGPATELSPPMLRPTGPATADAGASSSPARPRRPRKKGTR